MLRVTLAAAAILMITMGARQSLGLFISPINTATGLGITTISFAYAVAQLMWGVVQPVAGAVADRYGPSRVLMAGLVVMALGTALTPFMHSGLGLVLALGILAACGSGAGSFSVLIGAASRHLAPTQRGKAAGIVNAGGSFGQFVFAPISQALIQAVGWMGALWSLAALTLGALPLVGVVATKAPAHAGAGASPSQPWNAIREAMRDRSYLLLHAGFFTCGFHIAFLVTHLPGEVNLCSLPPSVASTSLALIGISNVVGSLLAGSSTARYRSKHILALMYGSRAVLIGAYLLAPKTSTDVLHLRRRSRPHLARHGAAHRGDRGQALRRALPRDALRPHPALAPGGRLLRRVPRRPGHRPHRQLQLDVVRRHGARLDGGAGEPADPRGARRAGARSRVSRATRALAAIDGSSYGFSTWLASACAMSASASSCSRKRCATALAAAARTAVT